MRICTHIILYCGNGDDYYDDGDDILHDSDNDRDNDNDNESDGDNDSDSDEICGFDSHN